MTDSVYNVNIWAIWMTAISERHSMSCITNALPQSIASPPLSCSSLCRQQLAVDQMGIPGSIICDQHMCHVTVHSGLTLVVKLFLHIQNMLYDRDISRILNLAG